MLVASRSAASLSTAQLVTAAITVAVVSPSSPASSGPSPAVGAAAAPSASDLALLGAIEVATRPAAAAASTLGGCLAAAVVGRAGPWERSGAASGAVGIADGQDLLSS